MRKLITALLAGVLICFGTLVSVVSVAEVKVNENREDTLKTQLREYRKFPTSELRKEQQALVSWQLNDLSSVEKYWLERWNDLPKTWKSGPRDSFTNVALHLASAYQDHGHFSEALKIYDILIDYDKKLFGANSKEVARDFNNRCLCNYLKGSAETKKVTRNEYFENALSDCKHSNDLWTKLQLKESEFNKLNNQKIADIISRDLLRSGKEKS